MRKIGILVAAALAAGLASAAVAATDGGGKNVVPPGKIEIGGDVALPTTLKFSELAILPQQTISVVIDAVTHTESGPYLESVLKLAAPGYLACSKNNLLRWWILVTNSSGASTAQ